MEYVKNVAMKEVLQQIYAGQILSEEIVYNLMKEIGEGKYSDTQISAFLSALNMRSVSVGELRGLRRAMQELCLSVDLGGVETIDLCGTGGDGKDTFNISTLSSFVVAGAGIPVTKHGNYAVSSNCGSSNVLEALGIQFTNNPDIIRKQISQANITFLHAPLFHPAMKHVAPARKGMQVKTVFNILGPLCNPCNPKVQVSGVYSLEIGRLYYYLLQESADRFAVVHALDGYDEISLTGDIKVFAHDGERYYTPKQFGFTRIQPQAIYGGNSVEESKDIFLNIITNRGTQAQVDVLLANSGLAIATFLKCSILDGVAIAKESLESGKAYQSLVKLKETLTYI